MQLKPESNLLTFGSDTNLSGGDIQRNWNNTVIEVFSKEHERSFIVNPIDIGTAYLKGPFFDKDKLQSSVKILSKNAFIIRESPSGGAVKYHGGIYWVSKVARRQWIRGACRENHHIGVLFPYDNPEREIGVAGEKFTEIMAAAFAQEYQTPDQFRQFVTKEKWPECFVITKAVWGVCKDQDTFSLFDGEFFIGIVDRNMSIIPVEETSTIAEEFINGYRLRPL